MEISSSRRAAIDTRRDYLRDSVRSVPMQVLPELDFESSALRMGLQDRVELAESEIGARQAAISKGQFGMALGFGGLAAGGLAYLLGAGLQNLSTPMLATTGLVLAGVGGVSGLVTAYSVSRQNLLGQDLAQLGELQQRTEKVLAPLPNRGAAWNRLHAEGITADTRPALRELFDDLQNCGVQWLVDGKTTRTGPEELLRAFEAPQELRFQAPGGGHRPYPIRSLEDLQVLDCLTSATPSTGLTDPELLDAITTVQRRQPGAFKHLRFHAHPLAVYNHALGREVPQHGIVDSQGRPVRAEAIKNSRVYQQIAFTS